VLNSSLRTDDIVDDAGDIIKSINAAISLEVVKVIRALSGHFAAVRKFIDHSFRQSVIHVANRSVRAGGIPLNIALEATDIELLKKMWIEKNTQLIKDIRSYGQILCMEKIKRHIFSHLRSHYWFHFHEFHL
jgi:hypothetical protein